MKQINSSGHKLTTKVNFITTNLVKVNIYFLKIWFYKIQEIGKDEHIFAHHFLSPPSWKLATLSLTFLHFFVSKLPNLCLLLVLLGSYLKPKPYYRYSTQQKSKRSLSWFKRSSAIDHGKRGWWCFAWFKRVWSPKEQVLKSL